MRHCCLLGFDSAGELGSSGQVYDLRSQLKINSAIECLFVGVAYDFDTLVLEIGRIVQSIEDARAATDGLLEFFLLTSDLIPTDLDVSVLLMALFSVLDRKVRNVEIFWVYENDPQGCKSSWAKVFPRLSFLARSALFKDVSLLNCAHIPMVGTIKFLDTEPSSLYLLVKACSTSSVVMGSVDTDWIRPFLFDEASLSFEFDFHSAAVKTTLTSKQGLLLKLNIPHDHAFMFLDPHAKRIQMVHSVYISTIENVFGCFIANSSSGTNTANQSSTNNLTPQFVRSKRASSTSRRQESSLLLDRSISLSDWNTQELPLSQDGYKTSNEDGIKKANKDLLKKLILLSLRRLGIKKDDKQFPTIWKHLYCGCVFALRKELSQDKVDQGVLLKTIKDNIKFLNIGQKGA